MGSLLLNSADQTSAMAAPAAAPVYKLRMRTGRPLPLTAVAATTPNRKHNASAGALQKTNAARAASGAVVSGNAAPAAGNAAPAAGNAVPVAVPAPAAPASPSSSGQSEANSTPTATGPATAPDPGTATSSSPTPSAPAAPTAVETMSPTPANEPVTDEELLKMANAQAAAESATEEVIVVTGSTFERKGLTSPAPVTVVDRKQIAAAGKTTIGDVLQRLPSNTGATNSQVNNGGDGSTRISLRGLGSQRTLVLINGRRVVPGGTGADASVDLNVIPMAAIERVEVLKDGASAVYGSDALGGVVNVITRKDYKGVEANIYSGTSQRADGTNYDANIAGGTTGKLGSIFGAVGFQRQHAVMSGDRAFSRVDRVYDYETGELTPSGSSAAPHGFLFTDMIDFDGDGAPDAMPRAICGAGETVCRSDGGTGWAPFKQPDDLYNYQPANYLYTPSERYNAYATGSLNLGKHARAFFEGFFVHRGSDQQLAPEPFFGGANISKNSIYNPFGADVLDGGYRRRLVEFGPRRSVQTVDTFRIVAGVDGQVADTAKTFKNWKWEASYNYGQTTAKQDSYGNLRLSKLAEALGPSFMDAQGVARCGTPDNIIADCVPMNILGPEGSISADARKHVTFTGGTDGYSRQHTVLAQASGRLAKLPGGGDISMALGGDYRREAGGFSPDALTASGDTTGNAITETKGKFSVIESFGELSIVPLKNKPYAQWLEVNLAARGVRYNTFGNAFTWKAGTLYKARGGVAVRGTYSTAFRAPAVGELFQGKSDSYQTGVDPCDATPPGADEPITLDPEVQARCTAQGVPQGAGFALGQQRAVVGGNAALKPETAKVFTAGVVWEPTFAKGLAITADYFDIRIADSITSLGSQIIMNNCYVRGQQEYCDAIKRDQTGAIDSIDDKLANAGSVKTAGVDMSVGYRYRTKPLGAMHHVVDGQYLRSYTLEKGGYNFDGLGNTSLGSNPRVRVNFNTLWSKGQVNGGLNVRYIGTLKECENSDCSVENVRSRKVPQYATADLFFGYAFKAAGGTTNVTVGVNNLTDATPSAIYDGTADSDPSIYDYMGRYFYLRLGHAF